MKTEPLIPTNHAGIHEAGVISRKRSANVPRAGFTIVVLTLVFSFGCRSSGPFRRSPKLATRDYNQVESQWQQSVKSSYPGWKSPEIPIEGRESTVPPPYQSPTELPAPKSLPPAPAKPALAPTPMPVKPQSTALPPANTPVHGYRLPSQNGQSGQFPEAVLDIDPPTPSARNDDGKGDFKIVPETEIMRRSSDNSGARAHVVQKGESLRAIARKYYGDESAWKRIYDANRSTLANPDQLKLGMTLRIP